MSQKKLKIAILLPDINSKICIGDEYEAVVLKNAFTELEEVELSATFTIDTIEKVTLFKPDILLTINYCPKKIFLKNGISIFLCFGNINIGMDNDTNLDIDEFLAYNADVYITNKIEIKNLLGNSKPVKLLKPSDFKNNNKRNKSEKDPQLNKGLIFFVKKIISIYKLYIEKYGYKPFLTQDVVIDDFIRLEDNEEITSLNKFIEEYNLITEKKKLLRYQLEQTELNRQTGKTLSIIRNLLLLEHGNTDLLQKYSETLKVLKLETHSRIFNENILNGISDTADESELNMEAYKEIELLIADNNLDDAQRLIFEKLEEFPSDQYFHYLQARIFYYKKELIKSKVILEDILITNPDFYIARNDLAIIYHETGNDFKAIECLKYALQNNYYNYDILKILGDLYNQNEMFEEALSIYKMILQQYPDNIHILKILAQLSSEAGHYEDSLIYLNHALTAEPENDEIKNIIFDVKKNLVKSSEENININRPDLPFVSIIIITYNNMYYTRETIKSIIKYTKVPYELIIIDNSSTDGTIDYLQNNSNLNVILNNYNKGFGAGCNQGISAAKGNYILLLNNDVIVTEGWLNRLLNHFKRDKNLGIVGPLTNYISGPQLDKDFLKLGYLSENILNEGDFVIQKYSESIYKKNMDVGEYFPRITGFCMLISRRVIETIGGFDERFEIGNFEDDDFCLRAQISGFTSVIASDVFIYHFGSKSFSLIGEKRFKEILSINRNKFIEKYGKSTEEIFSQKEIITNEITIRCNYEKYPLTKTASKRKKLALCMIVKDEADNLEKCLNSVVDLVDEIVIVDTGSTDTTKQIAEKYTKKVFLYNWKNDFSASRNYALAQIESEWILVMDADEELDSNSAISLIKSINLSDVDAWSLKIINILENDSFSKYDVLPLTRLFKNNKNFQYEGIIHEQIKNSILKEGGRIAQSDIKILHYGYKNINEEKISRNTDILNLALEKDPNNQYYLYQLGITLFSKTENDESIEYLKKAYELSLKNPGILGEDIIEKILIKISQYYLQRDNLKESGKYNQILLSKHTKNPIVHYIYAAILFSDKKYRKSLEILLELKKKLQESNEQGIDMHQIYIDLGNNYYILEDYNEAFIAFQSALEINNNSYVACYNLGNLLIKIGHYDDAIKMLEWSLKLKPELTKASELIDKINKIKSGIDDTKQ